ncbi:MAG: imidazole glycerol phosphate synthase subunit HisH [Candidatus Omnitrophica bacterium]|nr:imidazole glycerol phosphate synthase subunit HisH [Candidatus Omnitrophota bacterium]
MVALIDYGMGNIHSVKKALEICGGKVLVTNNPEDVLAAEKIVLPGVGAFDDAMRELEKQGLALVIKNAVKNNKPFLGICLGMQLLFEKSEEAKAKKGLGILKGVVKKIPKGDFKVPHMGWNQIKINKEDNCPLLDGIIDGAYVYFCHSYYPVPHEIKVIAATTEHGINFTSIVHKKSVYGAQFHPEKSQGVGLKIIDNFLKVC